MCAALPASCMKVFAVSLSSARMVIATQAGLQKNERFPDPAQLFVVPDHYVFRMLVSQGVPMADLGVPRVDGGAVETDPRKIWHRFAENYHLLRGTPSSMWLDHSFEHVLGLMNA